MPLVSFGMPVHNGAQFLDGAISSLRAQSVEDFEIVISDNASSDATPDICLAHAERDRRIRYVRQPANVGAARNYNAVFDMATGTYFKWATHDDLLAPDFLEQCVAALEGSGDAVLCAPATMLIDRDGRPLGQTSRAHLFVDGAGETWYVPRAPSPRLGASGAARRFCAFVGQPSSCFEVFGLIRRSALQKTLLIEPYWGADKMLLAELCLLGRFIVLDDPLFLRRCHHSQSSALSQRMRERWISGRDRNPYVQQVRMLLKYLVVLRRHAISRSELLECLGYLMLRSISPAKMRQMFNALLEHGA